MSDDGGHLGQVSDDGGHLGQVSDKGRHLEQVSDDGRHLGQVSDDGGHIGQVSDGGGHLGQMSDDGGHLGQVSDGGGHLGQVSDDGRHFGQVSDGGGHLGQVSDDSIFFPCCPGFRRGYIYILVILITEHDTRYITNNLINNVTNMTRISTVFKHSRYEFFNTAMQQYCIMPTTQSTCFNRLKFAPIFYCTVMMAAILVR